MTTGLDPALEYHIVNSLGWPDLRPLQRESVAPILRGDDCLLLAPTAGGKTEAATFPLLSKMSDEQWSGLSVLYVTPLGAAKQPAATPGRVRQLDRPTSGPLARGRHHGGPQATTR